MALNPVISRVVDAKSLLGEGPVWDEARQVLWFVDIKAKRLWQYNPATQASWHADAPGQIGWALPAEGGKLLCGLQSGLFVFDPDSRNFEKLMSVSGEPAGNRLNDACTDPWGRVWFGSMDDAEDAKSGRFYMFEAGAIKALGPSLIAITNGPASSPSGDRIYFTDTLGKQIMVAALSRDGSLDEIRPFADISADFPDAYPDGPIVDAEEHVWTGLYLGAGAARYSPNGKLVDKVALPARDITKLAFGGANLTTIFATTATKDLDASDMTADCAAGYLLAFDLGIRGAPVTLARLG